jgi:outer membrane protein insertion porin family
MALLVRALSKCLAYVAFVQLCIVLCVCATPQEHEPLQEGLYLDDDLVQEHSQPALAPSPSFDSIEDTDALMLESAQYEAEVPVEEAQEENVAEPIHYEKIIVDIKVEGNKRVSEEAVLTKIPYAIGQRWHPRYTRTLINNLLEMGYFKQVRVYEEESDNPAHMVLVVEVEEKRPLKEVKFEGNKNLSQKDIEKKIKFADIPTIDALDLKKYINAIKKLYRDRNYHNAKITARLEDVGESSRLIFTIEEGIPSLVKRVHFEGNKTVSSKTLRGLLFTREDWLLGFMDKAGTYQPDAIEADRQAIENYYQSNGFLQAKVTDVTINEDPETHHIEITFHIDEGKQFTVAAITIPGNEMVSQEQLLAAIPIKVGDLYSKERIRLAIDVLRAVWGEYGYIYADIEPSIEPNEENQTVALSFFSELGDKVQVDKIRFRGNLKTRDKVLRRQLLFEEGDLLTTNKLETSKQRIEGLGYFDQQAGVSWKIIRRDKDHADLDMYVKEVKTGRVDGQIGFGGSPKDLQNPTESFRVAGSISDTNLFGTGIAFNLNGEASKQERQLLFNITEPYLFDRPIYAALDAAVKRSIYDEFKLTKEEVREQLVSGGLSLGFLAQNYWQTRVVFQAGAEGVHYSPQPEINLNDFTDPREIEEFNKILRKRFPSGNFGWLAVQSGQDFRNHPMHPNRGYQWLFQSRIGLPNQEFGFWKFDLDGSYYTPLIGERDLVLYLHGHAGAVTAFQGRTIPFRELYHIGGPASVRGFLFGEIGPMYKGLDSLGAKKAFWLNAELIFPVSPDQSIKGVLFYDGGAGWDTPDADQIAKKRLKNNRFSYRHSVGFGARILRPTPIKIDWGFKLDKRKGEKTSQVHLSMYHDF